MFVLLNGSLNETDMKALIFANREKNIRATQALILISLLLLSPLAAWAHSDIEGGDHSMNPPAELKMADIESELSIEEWMTQPFELSPADFESELSMEDWMAQPFELSPADFESELSLEEWMKKPFDHGFSDFEEALDIEDWMIQPF